MRLTRQYEIAVSILETCARAPDRQWTTRQVAEIARTTKDHAAQVVAGLVRTGYLRSERGRRGGLLLARAPKEIGLGDILRLSHRGFVMSQDASAKNSEVEPTTFGVILEAGLASFVRFMNRFTIADLVTGYTFGPVACFECNLVNPARGATVTSSPTISSKSLSRQHEPVKTARAPASDSTRKVRPSDHDYHPR